jgi:hypothetical protein
VTKLSRNEYGIPTEFGTHEELVYYKLAEQLMTDVAGLLNQYKLHTADHPDDDLRILTIGHMEANIKLAREILYGVGGEHGDSD